MSNVHLIWLPLESAMPRHGLTSPQEHLVNPSTLLRSRSFYMDCYDIWLYTFGWPCFLIGQNWLPSMDHHIVVHLTRLIDRSMCELWMAWTSLVCRLCAPRCLSSGRTSTRTWGTRNTQLLRSCTRTCICSMEQFHVCSTWLVATQLNLTKFVWIELMEYTLWTVGEVNILYKR